MKLAPELEVEAQRMCALEDLDILDSPPEERFDRITRLAKEIFNVPIALVSLVDSNRQWFKSRQGLDAKETPRDISFCGHAIAHNELFIIEDTLKDARFHDNPLVINEPHIRFYAGYQLKVAGGQSIGTLCIIDRKPRKLTLDERKLLRDLGSMVESELRGPPGTRRRTDNLNIGFRIPRWLQTVIWSISSRPGAICLTFLFALIAIGVAIQWDQSNQQIHQADEKNETLQQMSLVRGTLETALNSKLHLVHGLSGFARSGISINDEYFQIFAAELAKNTTSLRSLQLAPNGIVTHVWPRGPNAKAIGHDLLADPERRQAAELAINAKAMWLAGPVNLIQGGVALIARQPIFMPDSEHPDKETFWGFGTLLLDLPEFLKELQLGPSDDKFLYAIRGSDALGDKGEVFFGDPEIFNQNPLIDNVYLPAGKWELAIRPIKSLGTAWPGQQTFRLGVVLAIAFFSGLIYFLLRLPHNTRRSIEIATSALERSEYRFRDAIESLPDGVAIYDEQDKLVVHNERFREIYNKSWQVIVSGSTYEELILHALAQGQFANVDPSDESDFLDNLLERHRKAEANQEVALYDGRWVKAVERRMRDGGTVTLHTDITDKRNDELALINAREKAEQANETKTTFLATISHEVRTPLNGVLGLLAVLTEDRTLSDKQKKYVKTAHISAKQLLNILNEILDVSKMEAGKLELDEGPFSLTETIEGAIDLIRAQAEQKSLLIKSEIDADISVTAMGDEGRLRQVLLNLLSNSVKFTQQGEITVKAEVLELTDENLKTRISVSDTGIGFSSDQATALFQPFAQLDSDSTRKISGTGLGLSICKHLVESMGGEISAEGIPGEGACFSININLKRAADTKHAQQQGSEQSLLPVNLGWTPVRILLTEDSTTNQMVIQAMLADTGYLVDTANNGLEALTALDQFDYDLILMDIFMPEMDGITATQEIRKKARHKTTPIIALTANAMKGDRERFMEAGMDDYLPKPVNKVELLDTLYQYSVKFREPATEPKPNTS